MKKIIISTCFILLIRVFSFSQNPGDITFQSAIVHDINITFTQTNWLDSLMYNKMHADSFNLSTKSMMASVTIDGTPIDSIGVSLKGNSSFSYPGTKKPIKLSLNEYVSGKKFDGMKTINLNNNFLDPTYMREKLLLDFLNKKGLPAPRCTYAKVSYNGQYVGLYKMIEQLDKTFLKTHFGNNGGNLFKGDPAGTLNWIDNNPTSYYPYYELHSNTTANNWSDFVNFIDNINNTPPATFYDTLETNLNTLPMIKQWAARNLFVDLDAYFHAPHNYYLYHNTATNKFEWNTWDVSVAFGFYPMWKADSTEKVSVLMAYNPLVSRMLVDSTYKTTYLNMICEYLDYFSNTVLDPQIDSIANAIRPYIYAEPDSNQMFSEYGFENGMNAFRVITPMGDIPGLKVFITNRRNNVINQLASLPFTCTVGVQDLSDLKDDLKIYPNPFISSATLKITNVALTNCELKIYDILGREARPEIIRNSDSFIINRGNLASGIYFYQVKDNKRFFAFGKLIIQ